MARLGARSQGGGLAHGFAGHKHGRGREDSDEGLRVTAQASIVMDTMTFGHYDPGITGSLAQGGISRSADRIPAASAFNDSTLNTSSRTSGHGQASGVGAVIRKLSEPLTCGFELMENSQFRGDGGKLEMDNGLG
ncbi:hypothetical protein PG995_006368 [Apiospora arundinis]|uniref:Uncharacterized protein n=1 Tax=Apiospora arundinis TaxID=335852 RepID=A0ABR2IWX1_9PEZI